MSDAVHLSDLGGGLFSPEEQRRLLWAEFERARRYGLPLACLVAGVDRLGQLQDLYGRDSKQEIYRSVLSGLRAETRASDFVAALIDDRLLLVLPHAPLEGTRHLARRLQRLVRRLRFRGDSRSIEIALSIGLCHGRGDDLLEPEAFLQQASRAQRQAAQLGGDRIAEAPAPRAKGARPRGGEGSPEAADDLSGLLDRLAASGESSALVGALVELLQNRGSQGGAEGSPGMRALEERVGHMAALLEKVERSLESLGGRGSPGAAAPPERADRVRALGALREELMGRIFHANEELREEIARRKAAAAPPGPKASGAD